MEEKIHVLSPDVADKIAAGEVAERPSSVVKELVENAVDAGTDKITVEIKNGGIKLIRVADNGKGIPSEQVPTAFLRHATSKLNTADDLYNISTMGFRGEALSSICAVAKVEIITKTAEAETGVHYIVDHGICGEADEIACADGTIMVVEDLFANVPARMKFLKKDSTEAGYISDLMTRLALSKPNISFDYICDGKPVFKTSGDGDLTNVILKVYGLKFAKAVMPVDYFENGVKISGVIGKPELSFGNRTKQTIFVNGRYIKNHVIAKVAEEAFRNAVMIGKFPFFVLNIEVPPEMVDVNVHPAKTEVKFANEKQLYDIVYHAVKNAMYGIKVSEEKADQSAKTIQTNKTFSKSKETPKLKDSAVLNEKVIHDYLEYTKPVINKSEILDTTPLEKTPDENMDENAAESSDNGGVLDKVVDIIDNFLEPDKEEVSDNISNDVNEATPQTKKEFKQTEFGDVDKIFDNSDSIFKDYKIIGQVFDTYVLLSAADRFYMIDQHAAHERDGFEKLKKAYFNNERLSQVLMSPIVINLSHVEYDAVMSNLDEFERFGFDVGEFGFNTVVVNETPIIAGDEQIKDLFLEITDALVDNIKHPIADFEEKALDMISCKKAIKGNDKLSLPEMTEVIKIVENLYSKGIKTCPHGRPIMVEFTKKEIEKMFKRIV